MCAAHATPPLIIARIAEGDLEEVAAVDVASFPGATSGPEERVVQLREELIRPWSSIWVGRVDARIVAYLLMWSVVDEIHVLNVATLPGERRRGYARALLDHVLGAARSGGVRHVLLEVRRSNRAAIELYRSLRFSASGIRRRYYPDDEDAIEMALTFDPSTLEIVPRADEVELD